MERFFLEHSVQRDRDADELGGRRLAADSDSETSDPEEEVTDRVRSVGDPTGPWRQTPVASGSGWGQPGSGRAGVGGPRAYRSAHTGPKGVLNDYRAHKRQQRQERARREDERQRTLLRIAKGAPALGPLEPPPPQQRGASDEDDEEEGDDELDDPAIMDEYRRQRLAQLQAAAQAQAPPDPPVVHGWLEYLSPERFVQLVDLAPPAAEMLVHLYDPESYACELLNRQLEALATRLVHVKFGALVAKQADASIAAADLPVVLLYRGGALLETVVHVSRALDGAFTPEGVEEFVRGRLERL